MSVSSVSGNSQRNAAAWLGARVVLVLIAVALLSLVTVELEVRAGVIPLDAALSWEFGGE
jgi:hypothetical protein